MPGRTFSVEFKRKVVGELERKEKTIVQLCREHSLAEGQIHKWRKLFGAGAVAGTAAEGKGSETGAAEIQALQRKVAELERLCGQITLENAYLKNSLATYPKKRG
jgi:transposase-like protein